MRNVLLSGPRDGVLETLTRRRESPPDAPSPAAKRSRARAWRIASYLAVLFGCLLLTGQLPFLTAATGTTIPHETSVQCLANHGLGRWPFSCPDIGLPTGARLIQGLPVVLLGWALTLLPGVSAHLAVEITDVLVLALAFEGARRLLRRFGVGDAVSLGAAALYVISPSLLALASFSGTYWGMLLLPAILELHAVLLGRWRHGTRWARGWLTAAWLVVQLGVLLLDGYTFVLTLVATALLLPAAVRGMPPRTALGASATYVACTLGAYAAYQKYVPGGDYVRSSIDLVRAMGVDVVTLVQPSAQEWWAHLTGHAVKTSWLWGDGTNATGNNLGYFCLGLAVVALVRHRSRQRRLVLGLLGCFVVGLLMSLGPSLKVDNRRPPSTGEISYSSYLMPPSAATIGLPTEVLHDKAPGVNQMRASYRWLLLSRWSLVALGAIGLQSLLLGAQRREGLARRAMPAVIGVLAVVELMPNPAHVLSTYRAGDRTRQAITEIAGDLRHAISPGSVVVFAPGTGIGDDTIGSFLAPSAHLRTYDVGEDKTIAISRPHWPAEVRRLLAGQDSVRSLEAALSKHELDAVVIPRFDPRWSVYRWPPAQVYRQRGDDFARAVAAATDLQVARHQDFYVVTLP
jgi:hypothetical protein